MFAKAKKLTVSAKQFEDVLPTLGERDTEIVFFDIRLMRSDAVDCADVSGVFLARKQLFAVRCKQFKIVHAVAAVVRFGVDNPLPYDAFVVFGGRFFFLVGDGDMQFFNAFLQDSRLCKTLGRFDGAFRTLDSGIVCARAKQGAFAV